jgi:hypothetical protein
LSTKGSEPSSLSRAIAELESVEKRLAELTGAATDEHAAAQIQEGRTLVRAAVRALALALPTPAEPSATPLTDDASGKRGKAKGKGATKPAMPEDRAIPNASADAGKDQSARSLLARLDAAVPEPAQPNTPLGTAIAEPAHATKPSIGDITAQDAAARLARLEAEIAGLTERPLGASSTDDLPSIIQTTPARESIKPGSSPASSVHLKTPVVSEPAADSEDAEGDDAEIEIVTAGERKRAGSTQQARSASRIVPAPPSSREEEAQVDIVRPHTATSGPAAEAQAPDKLSARLPMPSGKSGQGTKWRLFRD